MILTALPARDRFFRLDDVRHRLLNRGPAASRQGRAGNREARDAKKVPTRVAFKGRVVMTVARIVMDDRKLTLRLPIRQAEPIAL